MRKLFLHIMMSLDGYIEDKNGGLDWHHADTEFETYILDLLRNIDGMIYGRVSHQLLAGYWPTAGDNPEVSAAHMEMAQLMNHLPKYVITNGDYRTDWQNSEIISGDITAEIQRLKAMPGNDIPLFAGAKTLQSLMQLGLVDEYRILVHPVLLGGGTPLFADTETRTGFQLIDSKTFDSGKVLLTYTDSLQAAYDHA